MIAARACWTAVKAFSKRFRRCEKATAESNIEFFAASLSRIALFKLRSNSNAFGTDSVIDHDAPLPSPPKKLE
jgi:hypothetical protein